MITGTTTLIAHLGYPTHTFASPSICNPWFEENGIDAAVVPMSARGEGYPSLFRSLFTLTNIRGALVTMPHKVTTLDLVDEVSPAAAVAGATNAVLRRSDGSLLAEQFDGAGFVRAMVRRGFDPRGTRALVVGTGGVGSAIAASLAQAQVGEIGLFNRDTALAEALARRLGTHYPRVETRVGPRDPRGYDLVVNATSLGMHEGDPLPVNLDEVRSDVYIADVVNTTQTTAFVAEARARGLTTQVGADMLFEMVPAYLAFFGFDGADAEDLRRIRQARAGSEVERRPSAGNQMRSV